MNFSLYPPTVLFALLLAAFVAGLARGFSGFGAALIFVPLASAVVGPRMAGPILLVIDIVASFPLIPDAFGKADKQAVGLMSMGAVVAVPLGVMALMHFDPLATRWGISLTAIGFLLLLLSGWRYRSKPVAATTFGIGVIAGFFSGAAQLGGPPVVTYWLGGQHKAAHVRANIVIYFAISSIFSAVSYWWAELLGLQVFALAIMTGPVYGFGLYLGARSFGYAREDVFRRICFALIAISAIVSLPLWDSLKI
ncbi:sulfite exporter TauE/SafE family protein [Rhizobium sp. TRM95796]|uniref:sulfite exporter TauE/SafE family protein n=1 Tax=Rhizobium sp. TRM95796 TaxID=2979862 RepID=UPI0021E95EAB|nr:sulfite exporter TauE/SafE family protein [Rhizobium sp. TRM95796]MCV3766074.1 sulfite exporter TauE/SafE family protein [Rhizobium sp. TRM95796]